nr:LysR family transcriptional regulator [uncultured Marvinbryantia sp.]
MDLERLNEFIVIAEKKSIKKAAGELLLSPAALSARLCAFERSLGITLFNRSVSPLALTSDGSRFYEDAREIIRRFNALKQELQQTAPHLLVPGKTARLSTEKLYEFLVLSKALNYSRAAANLYISQSVLSKHIQDMEQELGVKLFFRTTHGVSLTNSGKLLAQRTESLIDQCNRAVSLLQISNLPIQGNIRIACALELAQSAHMQIFVKRFLERYPDIFIDFDVKSGGMPERLLQTQVYDFVFSPCEYQNIPPDIQAHLVASHGTYAALYPGHPLISKSLIQLRELEGENIIVPFSHEYFGPYAKNWLLAKKYTHDRVTCIPAPNLSSALFQVAIGRGIAIIPRYAKKFASDNIFTIGIANAACRFNEYLYYNESIKNGAAKLFFAEFCSTYPADI